MKTQSRILFWLLLAATMAVDLIAIAWISENRTARAGAALYEALCFGQLSVVAIWIVFGRSSLPIRLVVLCLALFAAVAPTARLFEFSWPEVLGFFGAYLTALAISLWVLRHTSFVHRASGDGRPAWQFSLTQILGLMSIVGVLLVLLRGSELGQIPEAVIADVVSSCALVVGVVITWFRRWRLVLRIACALGVAMAFGVMTWVYDYFRADPLLDIGFADWPLYVASSLIQVLVMYLWLEIGQIAPLEVGSTETPTGPAEQQ